MVLALGICAALVERQRSGAGQVIDAAMVEGAALLATPFYGYAQTGAWSAERGTNIVDCGAPFYDVYETSDGRWLSVAAMEPKFYAALLALLGLDGEDLPDQHDRNAWPAMKERAGAALQPHADGAVALASPSGRAHGGGAGRLGLRRGADRRAAAAGRDRRDPRSRGMSAVTAA